MSDFPIPPRPPTPQVLLHRLPDKPESLDLTREPSKYIILLTGPTSVAGKVQIARSVARALCCPLYQGDSLHDSSAKAASVGSSRVAPVAPIPAIATNEVTASETGGSREALSTQIGAPVPGPSEARYQRMWLSKLTRTGLLFPEESRPATQGFSGFGGRLSTSTSRRGSASSVTSLSSSLGPSSSVSSGGRESASTAYSTLPMAASFTSRAPPVDHNGGPVLSEEERLRRDNPALMVLTHPDLEPWHKLSIRTAVGDYGIGVIFVPLYSDEEDGEEGRGESVGTDLPVLRPSDPTAITSFPGPFDTGGQNQRLDQEIKLRVDVNYDVEGKTAQIIEGVKDVIGMETSRRQCR